MLLDMNKCKVIGLILSLVVIPALGENMNTAKYYLAMGPTDDCSAFERSNDGIRTEYPIRRICNNVGFSQISQTF